MRTRRFEKWLDIVRGLGSGTIASRIANCERVERFEGDLDAHFEADGLQRLIERLTYLAEDERFGRRPDHGVPISGNVRNGSATLKSAVKLYREFRRSPHSVQAPGSQETLARRQRSPAWAQRGVSRWPDWPQPSEETLFTLAQELVPLARFLDPAIVGAVAEDNRRRRSEWSQRLEAFGIDPEIYLWDGSPCAFPGVRRHAGGKEISAFRNRSTPDTPPVHCLALDDNDYPKHLWAFVFTGRPFRKRGPDGYQLAHIFDHKEHGNRWSEELDVAAGGGNPGPLFGLFTSASNAAYLPAFLRPTNFSHRLRTLLQGRAIALYGEVCRPVPPPLQIKACDDPVWRPERFSWSEPMGDPAHIPAFLSFRRERMYELLGQQGRARQP